MRPIPGFSDYSITDDGRIWSVPRKTRAGNRLKGKWLKPRVGSNGYVYVDLTDAGQVTRKLIHRLVLETFVGPCPEGMEACHGNGVRDDNRLDNLRWDTRSNNHLDAVHHGTAPNLDGSAGRGERNGHAKLSSTQVREIDALWREGGYQQITLAAMYGVQQPCIEKIVRHRTWRHLWGDAA